jgi:uncharacterized membrane protein
MKMLLFACVFLSGLITGLFYSYSCSVNVGLKSLQDSEYLRAMQSINRAILNPYFFISFIGVLAVYPFALYRVYTNLAIPSFYFLAAAAVIYLAGVFGVTIFGNVPLNNQLDQFSISGASTTEITAMRTAFEKPWNNFHAIRTIACLISFGLTILSLAKQKL